MAAREVVSVELWDAGRNARLAIPGTAPAEHDLWPYVADDKFEERLGQPAKLTLTLEVGCAPVVADPIFLARRRVLRVIYNDASFEEYRITRFEREISGESPPVVVAESLWTDLDTRVARRVLQASGFVDVSFVILRRPAQQLLEQILADAPAHFVAGSAGEFAAREGSIASRGAKHLALLRQLCQDLGAEWEAVWDPAEKVYRINLVKEVGGPGVRPIEQGAGTQGNRRTLRRSHDGTDLFTRIVPLAGPDEEITTIARATWPVVGSSYSSGTGRTTLQLGGDPIWVDGVPFGAGEAGQFGVDGQWHTVVSTAVPGTIVVQGDARALTAGRFRLASGEDLTYIADPAAEVETSVVERVERRSDIPPAANLLEEAGISADLTEWAGGLPVGVARIGAPTVTQTTDERSARVGGMAARVGAAAGEGIETIPVDISPTDRSPYFSAAAALRVLAGGVRLEVIGSDGKSYPLGDAATSSEDLLRGLLIGGIRPPAGGARLRITALQDGTLFDLDSWTLTQSATPYDYAPEMGPQALWHAGARLLAMDGGLTPDAIDGAVIDVAHFDGTAADEILIGSRVQVDDSGLDLETRVVGLDRGYKAGGMASYWKRVALSRRRPDLIDYLGGDKRPDRRLAEGGDTKPAPAVAIQGVRVDHAGRVVASAGGGEVVRRILITAAVGGAPPVPTPATHHGVIDGSSGTVQTTVSAALGDVVRIMARGESADGVLGPVAEAEYQVPDDGEAIYYAECQARVTSSTATTITVQVDAVPAGATVYLYSLTGATLQSGAGLGTPVPAGSTWTFIRPAFGAGEGQAVFRAESPGYQSDDDHVVIADQGRDTIGLLMRARVLTVTPTQIVVRVSVADPIDPTRTGAITVTPSQVGTGGVTPGTAQTIAASAVRADIDATGYIDFTITRGPVGGGGGRVVFTATRTGRVADSDAVDVPERTSYLPVCEITLESITSLVARYRIKGVDHKGGTTGLQYRHAYHWSHTPFVGWPNWQSLPAAGVLIEVPRHAKYTTIIGAQVRDADQRVSTDAWQPLGPDSPAISPGGKIVRSVPTEDGQTLESEAGAWGKAEWAEASAEDTMFNRGLKATGFDGNVGTGSGARPASQVVDGTDRARTGLSSAGDVARTVPLPRLTPSLPDVHATTGRVASVGGKTSMDLADATTRAQSGLHVDGSVAKTVPLQRLTPSLPDIDTTTGRVATVGELDAVALSRQVQEPSQNLMGPGMAAPTSSPPGLRSGAAVPINVLGLSPGNPYTLSLDIGAEGGATARARIRWTTPGGNVYHQTPPSTAAPWARTDTGGRTVPEGATALRLELENLAAVGTARADRWMLNRGPIALPFEEPPGRPGREGIEIWRGSLNSDVTRSDGSRPLVITAGTRIYEARHGAADIEFDPPFQEAPAVLVIGPKTYSASLGHQVDQYRRWEADDVTAGGIGRVIMQLEALSGISSKTDPLTAGVLTAQGQSSALPSGITDKSVNGRYTVNYGVAIQATSSPGLGKIDITLIVAVDTAFAGSGWLERSTETYLLHAAAGGTKTLTLPNESLPVVVSALKKDDGVRLRIKHVIVEEFGGMGSYSIGVTPKNVQYTIATPQRDPPDNPGVWGEPGHVIVFGAT